jgi:hypothetical protein
MRGDDNDAFTVIDVERIGTDNSSSLAAGKFRKDGFNLRIGAGIDDLRLKTYAVGYFDLAGIEFSAWGCRIAAEVPRRVH